MKEEIKDGVTADIPKAVAPVVFARDCRGIAVSLDPVGGMSFTPKELSDFEIIGMLETALICYRTKVEKIMFPGPEGRGEALAEPQHKSPVTSTLPPVQQEGDNAR